MQVKLVEQKLSRLLKKNWKFVPSSSLARSLSVARSSMRMKGTRWISTRASTASRNTIKKIEWNAKQVWMRFPSAFGEGDSKKKKKENEIVRVPRNKKRERPSSRGFTHMKEEIEWFSLTWPVAAHTPKYYFLRFQLPTLSGSAMLQQRKQRGAWFKYIKGYTHVWETRLEFSWRRRGGYYLFESR